jgi:hypothetical protein
MKKPDWMQNEEELLEHPEAIAELMQLSPEEQKRIDQQFSADTKLQDAAVYWFQNAKKVQRT